MDDDRRRDAGAARPPTAAIDRPRLTEILDRGHAFTLISGPAGAGKSVLLSQWAWSLRESGVAVVRLALDERVTNIHLLLRELLARLLERHLVTDVETTHAVLRGFDSVRDPVARIRAAVADITEPCVILIDNAEQAGDMPLLDLTAELLAASPRLRIAVATRRSIVPRTLRALAATDAGVIGPAQLLFTADEARTVIERASGRPQPQLATDGVAALPLGARMLGIAAVTHGGPLDAATADVPQVADAMLAGLLRSDDPADFQEFLLQTAVPGIVTSDVVARLGWEGVAGRHLERAELSGLGMWEAADDGPAFVYTPALREALIRRLDRRPVEATAPIRRIVAAWAFEHGRHLEALSNALRARDYALASRFGRESWFLLSRTCPRDVEVLLQRENPLVLVRHPVLATVMALVLMRLGHRLRAFAYFQSAASTLRRQGADDDRVERFWMLSIAVLAERLAGQFRRSDVTADRVAETYDALTPAQRADCIGVTALLLSNCGLSHLFAGRLEDAVAVLEQGMAVRVSENVTFLEDGVVLRMPDDDGGWYHCAAVLAGIHAMRGRLAEARRILEEIAEADPPLAWRFDHFGIMEQLARAHIAVAAHDLDGARSRVAAVAHHLGTTELWPYIVSVQSEIEVRAGRGPEALLAVERALERGANSATSEAAAARLTVAHGLALLALGDPRAAERVLATVRVRSPGAHAVDAFRALLTGDDARAFADGEAARREAEDSGDTQWLGLSLLTVGVAAARLGRDRIGAQAMSFAAAIMREEDTSAPIALFDADALTAARQISDPSVRDEIDRHVARSAGTRPFPPMPPPVTLTTRELAVMRQLRRTSSTASIAEALFVSPNTVKVQRRSAYRKLGAATREQALLRGAELGLFGDDDPPAPPASRGPAME